MKAYRGILIAVLLVCAGCFYDSPLTGEHSLPIDSNLIGVWQEIADDGALPDQSDRMVVLRLSETEYLVHYPTRKEGGYYRAYPFSLGGVEGIQVEVLGSGTGPLEQGETDIYVVVSYSIIDGDLELSILNEKLVDDELSGTAAIKEAFLKHRGSEELFVEPGKFRRVQAGD